MSLEVRPARGTEREAVLRLRIDGVRRGFADCGDPAIVDTLVADIADPEQLDRDLADPSCYVIVAAKGDRVVGTAALQVDGDVGRMSSVAVAVAGHGIGSELMHCRLELARRLYLRKVWLETDTVNPEGVAHAERHGFTAVASRPGRRIPGNRVIRYERELD